ncbi:MAG TPA: hypothetical protein VEU62_16865 [Bryobacterales bacterium]|nr:hypothetical protein [Bryobacterales bacterium]
MTSTILAAALASQIGFYQWSGVPVRNNPDDLLTQARLQATAAGARLFRFYLGARYDYLHHPGAPAAAPTPAQILALPRYRAVLEDPKLDTVILTTYSTADYGAGPDDLNLLRPWTAAEDQLERRQITELCNFLYDHFGQSPKTVILANSEADDKMLEIMNYTGSPDLAVQNMIAWTRARHAAINDARAAHPTARLRLLHAFEISLVNLAIAPSGSAFTKSPQGRWNALRDVIPRIPFDLLFYSTYESINSPYETQNPDVAPAETAVRLRRDLNLIRDRARPSLSPLGRRLFGDRFVAAGELGFARDRYEHLPAGGVLPRLLTALQAVVNWGCPYIVLWQVFDAPRSGGEQYGFGLLDPDGHAPRLRPAGVASTPGCHTIQACLVPFLRPR